MFDDSMLHSVSLVDQTPSMFYASLDNTHNYFMADDIQTGGEIVQVTSAIAIHHLLYLGSHPRRILVTLLKVHRADDSFAVQEAVVKNLMVEVQDFDAVVVCLVRGLVLDGRLSFGSYQLAG